MTANTTAQPASMCTVAGAAVIGTTIEWYDFYLYTTSVSLILAPQFFPSANSLTSTLLAFGSVGVGFLARPFGGLLFAHYGDRVNRKSALIWSLFMIGGATTLMGLLPNYAAIGIAAPILLVTLRFIQGIAIGGEWGGAVLIAVENAPANRRALYGVFPQSGTPLGLLLSSLAILLTSMLPQHSYETWGWRIPFLFSFVLVVIGVIIRRHLNDVTPEEAGKTSAENNSIPLFTVVRDLPRTVLITTAAVFVAHALYVFTTFLPAYAQAEYGTSHRDAVVGLTIGAFVGLVVLFTTANLAENRDLRRIAAFGSLLSSAIGLIAFPTVVALRGTGVTLIVALAYAAAMIHFAVISTLLSKQYPPGVRYTGMTLAFQLSAVIGGGIFPIVISALVSKTGGAIWPAVVVMVGSGLVSAVSSLAARGDLLVGSREDTVDISSSTLNAK
ncbi:MFS transporter [Rhodococcus koreensis]